MKYKNMKISITDTAHLKAVCEVLWSLGYSEDYRTDWIPQTVKTLDHGVFQIFSLRCDECSESHKLVSLTDLLKMRDKMVENENP